MACSRFFVRISSLLMKPKLHSEIGAIDLDQRQEVEVIWLEVCSFKSKRSLLIGSIYRPPSYATVI